MTPAADLYARLLQPLRQSGIPYMVTGGLAAIIYGDPDIANMRQISGHLIDQAVLDTWLHRLGLTPEWQKVPSAT